MTLNYQASTIDLLICPKNQSTQPIPQDLAVALDAAKAAIPPSAPTQVVTEINGIPRPDTEILSDLNQAFNLRLRDLNISGSDFKLDWQSHLLGLAGIHELRHDGENWVWTENDNYFHHYGIRVKCQSGCSQEWNNFLNNNGIYLTMAIS